MLSCLWQAMIRIQGRFHGYSTPSDGSEGLQKKKEKKIIDPNPFPFHLTRMGQKNADMFCVWKTKQTKSIYQLEEKNKGHSMSVYVFSTRHCIKTWQRGAQKKKWPLQRIELSIYPRCNTNTIVGTIEMIFKLHSPPLRKKASAQN